MSKSVSVVMMNSVQTGKNVTAVFSSKEKAVEHSKAISKKWGVETWVETWDVE